MKKNCEGSRKNRGKGMDETTGRFCIALCGYLRIDRVEKVSKSISYVGFSIPRNI